MSFRSNLLSMIFLPSLLLIGCGGDGDFNIGNGDGSFGGGSGSGGQESTDQPESGSGGDDSDASTSNVSYLPLSVYIKNADYVGAFETGGVFWTEGSFPYIDGYLINPVDATTLLPLDTATVDDFEVTVNNVEIDPKESFPMLQKVLGNDVYLRTALIFDLTGSVNDIDLVALKNEAKAYVSDALSHSNKIISNQSFVIWSFGGDNPAVDDVVDLTGGFTNNLVALEAAIDGLSLYPSASSNLHKAVVKAIGGYVDESAVPEIDYTTDGDNELIDYFTSDGILLSQAVIFSSGPDTKSDFEQSEMVDAIQSQGLLKFESVSSSSEQSFTNKIVLYYILGGSEPGVEYSALSDEAEKTSNLILNAGVYSFSDSLIQDQISAIDTRIDLDNQYLFRFAFLPRQGNHTSLFQSKSNGFNYAISSEYKPENFPDFSLVPPDDPIGTPSYELSSLVEITGENGEYISEARTSLSEMTVFKPATRWTNLNYLPTDYTWNITGGTGTSNVDGSFTVATVTGASATLEVENTARGETAQITVTN